MRKLAAAVIAAVLVAGSAALTGPAAAGPPRGYHYATLAEAKQQMLGRSFLYGAPHRLMRLVGWDRVDQRKVGRRWYPRYRACRGAYYVGGLGYVCPSASSSAVRRDFGLGDLWTWLANGPSVPNVQATYHWGDLFSDVGGHADTLYHRIVRPCNTGLLVGSVGGVTVAGAPVALADAGALAGGAVVEAVGGPLAAVGIVWSGCVGFVLVHNAPQ